MVHVRRRCGAPLTHGGELVITVDLRGYSKNATFADKLLAANLLASDPFQVRERWNPALEVDDTQWATFEPNTYAGD